MTDPGKPFVFNEAEHSYKWNGGSVPSVTQIIRSAIGDPFSKVQPLVLERKRRVGVAVHRACELDADGRLDEGSIRPEIRPYLLAWRRFRAEMPLRVVVSEKPLYSRTYGFAGRPDFYVLLLHATFPRYAVVDVKTGYPGFAAGLQTAAYRMLLEEEYGAEEKAALRFTLRLKDDGKYSFDELKALSDTRDFLACLAVHRMKERAQWAQR